MRRVPPADAVPLSTSLDSVGPLARSVACCAAIDAIFSGEPEADFSDVAIEGLRLAVPRTLVLDQMDETVAGDDETVLRIASAIEVALGNISR